MRFSTTLSARDGTGCRALYELRIKAFRPRVDSPFDMFTPATPAPPHSEAAIVGKPWALKSLPPFPAVALELMSLLDNPDVSIKQVVNLLRIDPALSAEILRVSNSALYGLANRVDSISQAVVVLGSDTVKRIALTAALGRFSRRFMKNKSLKICWDHSVAGGFISEELAKLLDGPVDRAYTAGLLHDVGRLAILACYPDEYGNMLEVARENDFDELECERQLFDIDHCSAGDWLARSWNLPKDITAAIANHHDQKPHDSSVVSIVAAANKLADVLGFNVLPMPNETTVEEALEGLPLPEPEKAYERFEHFEDEIRQAVSSLSPA